MRDLVQEMDDLSDEEGELEDIVRVSLLLCFDLLWRVAHTQLGC